MSAESTSGETICRVGVFIDWQNCYRTARDAFGFTGPGIAGNVKPLALARLIAQARVEGQGAGQLSSARIYTGRASQRRDARTYAANRRQFQAWQNAGPEVRLVTRTLDYSLGRPREKGIDVALAIDLVRTTCFENEHDVAVVVSADTDLLPALELVIERAGSYGLEVAAWNGPLWSPKPLALAGSTIRQHKISRNVYDRIADATDYNLATAVSTGAQQLPYGRRRREGR